MKTSQRKVLISISKQFTIKYIDGLRNKQVRGFSIPAEACRKQVANFRLMILIATIATVVTVVVFLLGALLTPQKITYALWIHPGAIFAMIVVVLLWLKVFRVQRPTPTTMLVAKHWEPVRESLLQCGVITIMDRPIAEGGFTLQYAIEKALIQEARKIRNLEREGLQDKKDKAKKQLLSLRRHAIDYFMVNPPEVVVIFERAEKNPY